MRTGNMTRAQFDKLEREWERLNDPADEDDEFIEDNQDCEEEE